MLLNTLQMTPRVVLYADMIIYEKSGSHGNVIITATGHGVPPATGEFASSLEFHHVNRVNSPHDQLEKVQPVILEPGRIVSALKALFTTPRNTTGTTE
jgi:hypothetical protein